MIIYNCPRVPFEFFKALEIPYRRVEIKGCEFEGFHPNVCSFCKRTVVDLTKNAILFWVDSCDSMRRSADFLKRTNKVFELHLPTVVNQHSKKKLKEDLERIWCELQTFFGKKVTTQKLLEVQEKFQADLKRLENAVYSFEFEMAKVLYEELTANRWVGTTEKSGKLLIIVGAPIDENFVQSVEQAGGFAINATCSGPFAVFSELVNTSDPFENAAHRLLNQRLFCARSAQERKLDWIFKKFGSSTAVLHTVKFCDFYSFDESQLRAMGIKFVAIENDLSKPSHQVKTRLEALLEMDEKIVQTKKPTQAKYFIGIDSGSTTTKIAVIDKQENILYKRVVKTGPYPVKTARELFQAAISELRISEDDVFVVSTGYGRSMIDFANLQITEITCHARGIQQIFPEAKTIIDIGGQDSKVIKLNGKDVKDFVMNDKCAAGTGRFLEVMANVLDTPIEKIGELSLLSKQELAISSVCTVFAESEVISLRSSGHSIEDILNAVHMSIARRLLAMYNRVNGEDPTVLTGGVAKNIGVKNSLEKLLKTTIQVPDDPSITGALGAAIIGLETCR